MRRRLGLLLVLVLAGAAFAAQTAYGCSCVPVSAEDKLASADGAFVGTVVERRDSPPGPGGTIGSGDPTELRFRVERAYKGQLGEMVVVHTVRSGATCGLDAERGDRLALTLDRKNGRWEAGLCDIVDPEELERAAAPGPPATGKEPARYLLAGDFANTGLLSLDAAGRVVASAKGSPPPLLDACPGGARVLESSPVGARLRVRDVRTMEIVRDLDPRGRPVAIDCRTADARILAALVEPFADSGKARLVRYTGDRARTLRRLPARDAAFADVAWVAKTGLRPGILRVDVGTGRATRVADGRFTALAAAPGGRRAAARDAGGRLTVVSSRRVRRGPRTGPPTWTGGATLVARRAGDDDLTTYAADLRVVRRVDDLDPAAGGLIAADDGRVTAVQGGRLVTVGARSGGVRELARLPAGKPMLLVALGCDN